MLMCGSQAYSGYMDVTRDYSLLAYPLNDGELDRSTEQHFTVSSESDCSYSSSCHTPSSSDSEHWAYLCSVDAEDDVFTEREIVLSYDGCEVTDTESGATTFTYNKTEDTYYAESEKKTFKKDLKENSFHNTTSSIDESDVKNINISEINCTDSFLKWLDSEQDLGSPEYCAESDESIGNEYDSIDFQENSQEMFSTSGTYMINTSERQERSLPPIQTMIPIGSRIINSFPSERCYQGRDTFNTLIRGSATSLHMDTTVSLSCAERVNIVNPGHLA